MNISGSVKKGLTSFVNKFGIQTKAQKIEQKLLEKSVLENAKLNGEAYDLFVKNIHGETEHLIVTQKEVNEINESAKNTLRKCGINPESDNNDRLMTAQLSDDDPWKNAR